jgi:hypothetical protein
LEEEMGESLTGPALEQFHLMVRLESIFMPYARRQLDGLYDSGAKPTARFVHYTSAEASLKIIESKRVWMRNTYASREIEECSCIFLNLPIPKLPSPTNKDFTKGILDRI